MMNRFQSALMELRQWLMAQNIRPENVAITLTFRDPREMYGAEAQMIRDTDLCDPFVRVDPARGGRQGTMMGMKFKLEHEGFRGPHDVAEALRRLAAQVDEAGRPVPQPPTLSELTKAFTPPTLTHGDGKPRADD